MRFTKMHGLGNDYIFLDAFADPALANRTDLADLARVMSHRHTGIGADGLILVAPPVRPGTHARMTIYNSDGSEGGFCGNGSRCVAKLLIERGHVAIVKNAPLLIDIGPRTLAVTPSLAYRDSDSEEEIVYESTVEVGVPHFDLASVPVRPESLRPAPAPPNAAPHPVITHWAVASAVGEESAQRSACFASLGNPHMAIFTTEPVAELDLATLGPILEHHPAFPQRMNVHIVNILHPSRLRMRTWERGAGLTLACGSGACAVVALGHALGLLASNVSASMPGGTLDVEVDPASGAVSMRGPATEVFTGEWPA